MKLANSLVRVFIQPVLNLVGHAAISSPVGRSPITKIGAQFWNDTIPRMFLEHDRAIVWGGGDKRDRNPVTVHHFQNRIGRMGISSGFLVMDMGVKDRQFRCFMLAIRPCEGPKNAHCAQAQPTLGARCIPGASLPPCGLIVCLWCCLGR